VCVKTSLLTLQNQNPHTHTNTYARTLTNQHGGHRQCRRNDATELAHADMTTLPKVDTKCTAPSLMPTVSGNTVLSFSTHGHQSAAKGSSTTVSRSDIRLIQHFDSSALGLVRRWRLIGYFPNHLLLLIPMLYARTRTHARTYRYTVVHHYRYAHVHHFRYAHADES
jgi:hypothetical protein